MPQWLSIPWFGQDARQPAHRWLRGQRRKHLAAVVLGLVLMIGLAGLIVRHGATHTPVRRAGQVQRIADDLSIEVRYSGQAGPRQITLAGLNWPASRPTESRQWLEAELSGRQVIVVTRGTSTAALVYREDGLLVNEYAIDRGLALADPQADHELRDWFSRLERWARGSQRGIWENP